MARSRIIKPGAAKNEVLAELGPMTQFLFVMLPCFADREGRMEDRPKRIKAEVFPYYDADVDAMLQELADCEEHFIQRYEIDGTRYLQITNFAEHQTPHHKELDSTIPACVMLEPCMNHACVKHDNLGFQRKVTSNKNKVKVTSNKNGNENFEDWWQHYPRKAGKGAAAKAYDKALDRLKKRTFEADAVAFLLERVVAFSMSEVAKGDYCPHPATWLNQERYDDDPATWSRGSPSRDDPRGNLAIRDKLLAELEG